MQTRDPWVVLLRAWVAVAIGLWVAATSIMQFVGVSDAARGLGWFAEGLAILLGGLLQQVAKSRNWRGFREYHQRYYRIPLRQRLLDLESLIFWALCLLSIVSIGIYL